MQQNANYIVLYMIENGVELNKQMDQYHSKRLSNVKTEELSLTDTEYHQHRQ